MPKYGALQKFLLFTIPFLYPYRMFVNRYIHIHVFTIMYISIWALMLLLFTKSKTVIVTKGLLFILAYYFVTFFYTCDYDTGMKWIINVVVGILIGGCLNHLEYEYEWWMPIIIGVLLCSVSMLPSVVQLLPVNLTYMYTIRIPFMEGDISIGPNGWAATISTAYLITLIIIPYYKKHKIFIYAMLLALLGFCFITQSRSQFFTLIIISGLYILRTGADKKKTFFVNLLYKIIMVTVVLLFIWIMLTNFVVGSSSRLGSFDLNGRSEIWSEAINIFFFRMNPFQQLFGVGTGGTSVFLYNNIGSGFAWAASDHISAHSMYIDSLISSGVIGSVIAIGYWMHASYVLFFRAKKSTTFVAPLYILIAGFGGHLFIDWYYGIIIAITEMAMYKETMNTRKNWFVNVKL